MAAVALLCVIATACSGGGDETTPVGDAVAIPFDIAPFDAVGQDAGAANTGADVEPVDSAANADAGAPTDADAGVVDDAAEPAPDATEPVADGVASAPDSQSDSGADAEDPGLVLVPVNPAGEVSAVVTQLGKQNATFVRALGDSVLFGGKKGPVLWHPDIDSTVPISGTKGALIDAVQLGKIVLLATSQDLYAVAGGVAKSSPLGAAVAASGKKPAVTQMIVVPSKNPDLWLLAAGKLYLYRQGKLHNIAVKGFDLSGGRMAWGPKVKGKAAMWVAAGKKIAGIVVDGTKVQAWVEITDRPATAIGADCTDTLMRSSAAPLGSHHPSADHAAP